MRFVYLAIAIISMMIAVSLAALAFIRFNGNWVVLGLSGVAILVGWLYFSMFRLCRDIERENGGGHKTPFILPLRIALPRRK